MRLINFMQLSEVEIHASTDLGRCRKYNEDNFLLLQISTSKFLTKLTSSQENVIQSHNLEVDEKGIVLAVLDGCGGRVPDTSNEITVETVKNVLTGEVPDLDDSFYEGELIEKLYEATLYANRFVHQKGQTDSQGNGLGTTTFTAVGITSDSVDFIQVGDSRAYLIRKGEIYPVTKDQTLVNQLIDAGLIKPEEAETHALKNVILQALGAQNELFPDLVNLIPRKDDILLLCSDGLTNKILTEDLSSIILDNLNDLKKACQTLTEKANEKGGEDNITVILAKLLGNKLPEPTDEPVSIFRKVINASQSEND